RTWRGFSRGLCSPDAAGLRLRAGFVLERHKTDPRRTAMPKLRHIAIAAEDPEKMAEFYKKAFDFKEVGRPNGHLADGVFLSDGTLNMAILKFKSDQLGKGMDYRGL